ncbi:MAG: hypothetical protein M3P98_02365 [bacterium]|nr:hypothetical protein [bacterium]
MISEPLKWELLSESLAVESLEFIGEQLGDDVHVWRVYLLRYLQAVIHDSIELGIGLAELQSFSEKDYPQLPEQFQSYLAGDDDGYKRAIDEINRLNQGEK